MKLKIVEFITLFLSVFAIITSVFSTLYVLRSQQNFDVEVREVQELKDLRSDIFSFVAANGKCLPTSDLFNLGNNDCTQFAKDSDPTLLNLATQMRWMIYKRKYLFSNDDIVQMKLNAELAPLADNDKKDYELDAGEFLDFVKLTVDVVDKTLERRRTSFRGFF